MTKFSDTQRLDWLLTQKGIRWLLYDVDRADIDASMLADTSSKPVAPDTLAETSKAIADQYKAVADAADVSVTEED